MRSARPGALARWGTRLARDLTGRSAEQLVELLGTQLECAVLGAQLVEALTASKVSTEDARNTMRRLEHDGDEARAQLVAELGRVLATPVDAEDLFRLSRSIDDVLDNLRDFVREVDLYCPERLDSALPLTRTLVEGLESLRPALAELTGPRDAARQATLRTRKAAGQTRRLYQQQLAELFAHPFDGETLKQRELLRRLDVVALRLSEAADVLADGALKRSR